EKHGAYANACDSALQTSDARERYRARRASDSLRIEQVRGREAGREVSEDEGSVDRDHQDDRSEDPIAKPIEPRLPSDGRRCPNSCRERKVARLDRVASYLRHHQDEKCPGTNAVL